MFYRVLDTAIEVMERRFSAHKGLYLDLSWFDPRNFKVNMILPSQALEKLCTLIPNLDQFKLREQLDSFVKVWPRLKGQASGYDYGMEGVLGLEEEFERTNEMEEAEPPGTSSNEATATSSEGLQCSQSRKCTSCIKCAFKVIFEYNLYSLQYTELYKVYKYLLTK